MDRPRAGSKVPQHRWLKICKFVSGLAVVLVVGSGIRFLLLTVVAVVVFCWAVFFFPFFFVIPSAIHDYPAQPKGPCLSFPPKVFLICNGIGNGIGIVTDIVTDIVIDIVVDGTL